MLMRQLILKKIGLPWAFLKEYFSLCNISKSDVFKETDFNLKLLINSKYPSELSYDIMQTEN